MRFHALNPRAYALGYILAPLRGSKVLVDSTLYTNNENGLVSRLGLEQQKKINQKWGWLRRGGR